MNYKNTFKKLVISAVIGVLPFSVIAEEKLTLRMAHNLEKDHAVAVSMAEMAKQIELLSDGKMKVRIYPSGQMGTPRETIEMLQQGALDMAKATGTEIEPFKPIYAIYSLPYIFDNEEHLEKVIYGEIGKELNTYQKEKGFINIASYTAGSRNFYTKTPVKSLEDLQGKKIRVMASPTANKMVELLGGLPTPISYGETYTALQQGVLDGAENNIPTYVLGRHVEVAPYFTEDAHTRTPDFVTLSTKTWDKMTEIQKNIVKKAARISERNHIVRWKKIQSEAKAEAIKLGATFIQLDKSLFKEKLQPLYSVFKKDPIMASYMKRIQDIGN